MSVETGVKDMLKLQANKSVAQFQHMDDIGDLKLPVDIGTIFGILLF